MVRYTTFADVAESQPRVTCQTIQQASLGRPHRNTYKIVWSSLNELFGVLAILMGLSAGSCFLKRIVIENIPMDNMALDLP